MVRCQELTPPLQCHQAKVFGTNTGTDAAIPPGEGVRNEHRHRRCSGILGLLIVKQCVHSGHRRRSGIPDRLPTSSVSILDTEAQPDH